MDEPQCDYTNLDWRERKRVRESYIEYQDGRCFHCHAKLSGPASESMMALRINKRLFPASFWRHPVHLHHNHKTGNTIGAVHNQCNAVLWQYHGE